jgi:hypothetical protein
MLAITFSGPILWANLHLLFWLSLAPFATRWVGEFYDAPSPIALYGFMLHFASAPIGSSCAFKMRLATALYRQVFAKRHLPARYQFDSVSDSNLAALNHMTIQGQLSLELLNDPAQESAVLVEGIGVERSHHTAPTKDSYSDQDSSNSKHMTRPCSFSQPWNTADQNVWSQPSSIVPQQDTAPSAATRSGKRSGWGQGRAGVAR